MIVKCFLFFKSFLWEYFLWEFTYTVVLPSAVQQSESVKHTHTLFTLLSFGGRGTSLVARRVKRLPAMRETQVRSPGWEDPLEKEMATHSSTLAWRIPWTEEPAW